MWYADIIIYSIVDVCGMYRYYYLQCRRCVWYVDIIIYSVGDVCGM